MNKLELLGEVIGQFQLTPQEVVESFVNNQVVDSKFLGKMTEKARSFESISFIPSKKFVTPKDIQVGMFEYANGLIYPELIKEEQLRGIVGSVDGSEILVWCLRSQQCCWSENYWPAGTKDKQLRGWEATQIILETAKMLGETAPAAEYCAEYHFDGVEKGSAFLPSYTDSELLLPNITAVKAAYSRLKLGEFGEMLWSSSEYNIYTAWLFCVSSTEGLTDYDKDSYGNYVRPVRLVTR